MNSTDRALYIRIKVQHPLWSERRVEQEIERLRSIEFNMAINELYAKIKVRANENQSS